MAEDLGKNYCQTKPLSGQRGGLNPEPSDYKSVPLTTRLHCIPYVSNLIPSVLIRCSMKRSLMFPWCCSMKCLIMFWESTESLGSHRWVDILSSLRVQSEKCLSKQFLKSCLTRLPAGSLAVNWCEWSWQNHAVEICGMDEWTQCLPSQGLWSLFCKS